MILYVIVLEPKHAGEYTLFQGFSMNAVDEFGVIRAICKLPAHIDELFIGRDEVARWRMYGQTGYSILLLESEFFGQLESHPGSVCIISNGATHAAVAAHVAQRNNKRWLHVTTVALKETIMADFIKIAHVDRIPQEPFIATANTLLEEFR